MSTDAINLDNVIRKAAALRALADDPRTPPHEADSARAKADAIMFKYKIDSLTAPEQQGIARPVPVWKTIWVCRSDNSWQDHYYSIAVAAVNGAQCRYSAVYRTNEDDGHRWLALETVGYESDVRYAEVLLDSAMSAFGRHLEPKWDKGESDAANCLRLRRGGMERRRIAMAMFGGFQNDNEFKAQNRKVTNLIKAEAKRIGEPHLADEILGRGTNIATYRKSYADSFYWTLTSRMRTKAHADNSEATGLVLASAKDAVDEMFYERYPHLRPKARLEGTSANTQKDCEKCEKTKSGYCREHAWLRPRASRDTAYSSAGARAGTHAARSVDLGGSSSRSLA